MKIHCFAFLGISFELGNGGHGGYRWVPCGGYGTVGTVRVRYGYGMGTVQWAFFVFKVRVRWIRYGAYGMGTVGTVLWAR